MLTRKEAGCRESPPLSARQPCYRRPKICPNIGHTHTHTPQATAAGTPMPKGHTSSTSQPQSIQVDITHMYSSAPTDTPACRHMPNSLTHSAKSSAFRFSPPPFIPSTVLSLHPLLKERDFPARKERPLPSEGARDQYCLDSASMHFLLGCTRFKFMIQSDLKKKNRRGKAKMRMLGWCVQVFISTQSQTLRCRWLALPTP